MTTILITFKIKKGISPLFPGRHIFLRCTFSRAAKTKRRKIKRWKLATKLCIVCFLSFISSFHKSLPFETISFSMKDSSESHCNWCADSPPPPQESLKRRVHVPNTFSFRQLSLFPYSPSQLSYFTFAFLKSPTVLHKNNFCKIAILKPFWVWA